jgi:hypothetical protein
METGVVERRGLWLVLALVLVLRILFFNQAIQGDDPTYLAEAQHALIDPLHPSNTQYPFQGVMVDLRGHPHPPLNAWVLAALIAIRGRVEEIPFHATYTAFSLLAAWAMWSLARRFSPEPLWAALLFVAVPAFVVNGGSLEADLPFLAFWMAAIACFASGRLALSAAAMALAAMTAYQAIFLTPILAVYVWLYHGKDRGRWALILVPPATFAVWQIFTRWTTGAMPAEVLSGYYATLHTASAALRSSAALFIHFWFILCPPLAAGALVLAWRRRHDRDTRFLAAWIAIFFAAAMAIFFAGSARYLLPIAAPLALLASRLPRRWLAIGFAAQMALALGLALANYEVWDGYRRFAGSLRETVHSRRVWTDGELGMRYYFENEGALRLLRAQRLRPGDVVVSSALTHSLDLTSPVAMLAAAEIRPSIPLRIIGLETDSGYSTIQKGIWPFGISGGVVDRLRALQIMERHPALEYLLTNAPEAASQIVSGIDPDHWMGKTAEVVLKSSDSAKPLRVEFYISDQAPARHVTLRLDGREVASQQYPGPGPQVIESEPVRPAGAVATVEIEVDRTFRAPGDQRDLGVVVTAAGFR